ncbi:hypothetical protein BEL05_11885 [Shewanella colwelliana]|uniref:Uncharacterized protein n=1 Tax=Shewanella colwelliana TaxID=23 RepID=A0A1E5IR19_SHECO|nr:hypothetical protein BEL05_11885 [Shewanella colwelliana]
MGQKHVSFLLATHTKCSQIGESEIPSVNAAAAFASMDAGVEPTGMCLRRVAEVFAHSLTAGDK